MFDSPIPYAILYVLFLLVLTICLDVAPPSLRRKEFKDKWKAYDLAYSLSKRGQTISYILMHSANKTFRVSDNPKREGYVCIDRVQSMAYNTGR